MSFGIIIGPEFPPEVYLEGATTREAVLSREHQGPRAVLNSLDRLAGEYGPESDRVKQNIAIAEGQLRNNRARLGMPFPHDGYLSELTALRDQLKDGLSGKAPEGNAGPNASELADQIKALKAGNSIEATPQHVRPKHSSAEEPVTARIRRRTEAMSASDPVTKSETRR